MGALTYIDPSTVRCLPGKCLVEIVEILGGTTKGGLFIPGTFQDHAGKDTFYGKFLHIGPPPRLKHYKSGRGPGLDVRENSSGKVWPPAVMAQFKIGDLAIFPRDVELVFVWEEKRFGICYLHEAIAVLDADSFDAKQFEVVPWSPPSAPST